MTKVRYLIALGLMALFAAASTATASAATAPSQTVATSHASTMTSRTLVHATAVPRALISGDCGKVNFISYGNGNFYVIVDSYDGAIWWVDWQINTLTGSNSGTVWGNGSSHLEFGAQAGGGGLGGHGVLTGDAFTSGAGYCYFIPNPA